MTPIKKEIVTTVTIAVIFVMGFVKQHHYLIYCCLR